MNDETVQTKQPRQLIPDDDDKRTWLGFFFLGLGILIGFIVLVFAIMFANIDQNHNKVRIEQYRQETAQHCVDQGYTWVSGQCIPRSK